MRFPDISEPRALPLGTEVLAKLAQQPHKKLPDRLPVLRQAS